MLYKVIHKTEYNYKAPSTFSYNEAWVLPRQLPYQEVISSKVLVEPEPAVLQYRDDFFKNKVSFFNIQQPHKYFSVEAESTLNRKVPAYLGEEIPEIPWDEWAASLKTFDPELIEVKQYLLESPLVPFTEPLLAYAAPTFTKGRSLFEAINELNTRIYKEFEYNPGFTTIATPLSEVVAARKGVCQDFAHVAIATLRALGLPVRYVSGYIETLPPEGEPLLVGSAASHAWFSAYIPQMGWVDFDPTNNQIAKEQHITVAWGRDYTDVPPLKGVVFNSGEHDLSVSVSVLRIKKGE